ncbi:alginate export family protein [Salinisphaera sp. Q1T1-3]|uniref:alginate export family protein n=1 Tax=Salinisphaera sp. Q1T1-3 TaxID=2321229 RepID=UPI000E72FBAF|nr:alginate export family protein [Salinisphaera sp. Q1T1-3]RJS91100.1 alginate export family protein [Salinisphaera sp. Q1T1-3]
MPLRRHPFSIAGRALLTLALASSGAFAADPTDSARTAKPPPSKPLRPGPPRYLDQYKYLADTDTTARTWLDSLHFIELPRDSYLSLGGGGRARYESYENPAFGLAGVDHDGYFQTRAELHADLHLLDDALRAFVQINDTRSWDKKLRGPVDESHTEVAQAFVDFGFPQSGPGKGTLRFGRQQMSFGEGVLVTTRLVPNVRLSFDGFRLSVADDRGDSLDAFAVRPVDNLRTGSFDDSSQNAGSFYGLYGTVAWHDGISQDLYAFGYKRDQRTIAGQTGDETRNTLGTRLFGTLANVDYTVDLMYQTGDFDDRDISAWGVSSSYGYTFKDAPAHPGIALRLDAASGDDDPNDGTLRTFDPLFPSNGRFYGNGEYTTLANLVVVGPQFAVSPFKTLTFSPTILSLWKQAENDAVYLPAMRTVPGTQDTGGRHIGMSYDLFARWTPTDLITIDFEYQYYDVDGAIERAGGEDSQYFSVRTHLLF